MHKLLEKVEKELHNIAEKGISSANLDTTYKLIDIYKIFHPKAEECTELIKPYIDEITNFYKRFIDYLNKIMINSEKQGINLMVFQRTIIKNNRRDDK